MPLDLAYCRSTTDLLMLLTSLVMLIGTDSDELKDWKDLLSCVGREKSVLAESQTSLVSDP